MRTLLGYTAIVTALLVPLVFADTQSDTARTPPSTLSPQWAKLWPSVVARSAASRSAPSPAPNDLQGWATQQQTLEKNMAPLVGPALSAYQVKMTEETLAGVPVLVLEPKDWRDDGRLLIYVHGGGFVSLSAHSTLFSSALMANRTGMKVISVDYTLAPHARWQQITDQTIGVYKAVLAQGYRPESIGMWGDSAGGSIVAGSVLKLRDAGVPMPGALVLWAPWADVTGTGDTYVTLAAADPLLSMTQLKPAADAYADPADQKNPYVSPVYGDYSKGFPATLIQGGTREIFLSNFVREYQALAAADIPVVLDLYEGMPHVFQPMGPGSPEGGLAMRKVKAFWSEHLRVRAAN